MGHDGPMTRDWARLAEAYKVRRKALGISQRAAADRLNVVRATIQKIERGEEYSRVTPTHRAYARLLRWTEDSPEQILDGGQATEQPEEAPPPARRDVYDAEAAPVVDLSTRLPVRVVQDLQSDEPVLDTAVVPLDDADPSAGHMVIVVKGRPDADPETIKRALLRWEQAEAALRERGAEQA